MLMSSRPILDEIDQKDLRSKIYNIDITKTADWEVFEGLSRRNLYDQG